MVKVQMPAGAAEAEGEREMFPPLKKSWVGKMPLFVLFSQEEAGHLDF